jgi:hypothetical protein
VDEPTADASLDQSGVTPDQKADLLLFWRIERTTYGRALTPAQIVSAAKKGLLSGVEAHTRLVGQSYSPDDARILLAISNVDAESTQTG